ALKVSGDERAEVCLKGFAMVPGLVETAAEVGLAPRDDAEHTIGACELVLEGLAAHKRITRNEELGYTRAKPERREPGSGYGKGGIAFG
ncbi:MAG: magnesium chelatase, partial [bacterium]